MSVKIGKKMMMLPSDNIDAKIDLMQFACLRDGLYPAGKFCEAEIFEMFQAYISARCEHYATSFPSDDQDMRMFVSAGDAHKYMAEVFAEIAECDFKQIVNKMLDFRDGVELLKGQDQMNSIWAAFYLDQYYRVVMQQDPERGKQ